MSAYLYSDDDDWSDDSSNDYDSSTTTSVSVSEPEDPAWMEKFNNHKYLSDTETTLSKKTASTKSSKPADWLKKFERVKDGPPPSLESTPPTNENGKGESDDGRKFKIQVSPPSSVPKQNSNKSTDWLQKFERAKGRPIPTKFNDDDRGESGSVYIREVSSQTSPLKIDPKLTPKSSKNPVGETNKPESASPKTKKYRNKSQPRSRIDRAERRNRIRSNLEKLRRRERIRQNLGTLQAMREKEDKKGNTPPMTPTMTPKMRKKVKKYEKAIFKDMNGKIVPPYKENREVPVSSKIENQPEGEIGNGSQKKPENKWNETKAKQTPSIFERNNRASSAGTTSADVNRKPAQRQNIYDTVKQQKDDKTANNAKSIVTNSAKSEPSFWIKVPSIQSKINALQKSVDESNLNENTTYAKKERKASVIKPSVAATRNEHTNSQSPRINANLSIATHQKAQLGLTDGVPNKQIVDAKPPSINSNSPSPWKKATAPIAKYQKAKVGLTRLTNGVSKRQNADAKTPSISGTSLSPRIKATAPIAKHQEVEASFTNGVSKKQVADDKPPLISAEIENTVPENLFGMWGDTVKAKKPTPGTNAFSDKMVKKQADRVKQKIENARKGAMVEKQAIKVKQKIENARKDALGAGSNHNEVKVDLDDDAAALFHAAGSTNNYEENYSHRFDSEAFGLGGEVSMDMDDTGRYKESDGDDSMDEDAAAQVRATATTESNADKLDSETSEIYEEIYEEISVDMDDTGRNKDFDGDDSIDEDAAVPENDTDKIHSETSEIYEEIYEEISVDSDDTGRNKESDGEDTMDDDIFTSPLRGVGSTKTTTMNGANQVASKKIDFDDKSAEDMDDSEMNDTMDDDIFTSPLRGVGSAKSSIMNDANQVASKKIELDGEEASIDIDGSAINYEIDEDNTMDEDADVAQNDTIISAENTEKDRVSELESKKDGAATTEARQGDSGNKTKKKSGGKNQMNDVKPSPLLFYGATNGRYRNAPDLSSSSSNCADDDIQAEMKTSTTSLLNDSTSFSSSTLDSIPEKEKQNVSNTQEVVKKGTPHLEEGMNKKNEPDDSYKYLYTKNKSNVPNLDANKSFGDEGSFYASDFSDTEVVTSRKVKKKEKKSKEKKSKKKSKSKKSGSSKKLNSKKAKKKQK